MKKIFWFKIAEAVLTSTHYLCFENRYTPANPVFLYIVEYKGVYISYLNTDAYQHQVEATLVLLQTFSKNTYLIYSFIANALPSRNQSAGTYIFCYN